MQIIPKYVILIIVLKPYYFQKNLQGDIIGIVDKDSKVVAQYKYDAWGVPTITQDTTDCGIAQINPYRYRGYYFDIEIDMYYLQSRYYDPKVDRFVNADDAGYIQFINHKDVTKLYTYCLNDPINQSDLNGNIAVTLVRKICSAVLGGVLGGISVLITDILISAINKTKLKLSKWYEYLMAVVDGAIEGFFEIGLIVSVLKSALLNIIKQLIGMFNGGKFDFEKVFFASIEGIFDWIFGNMSLKVPKNIRDIKQQAAKKFIKGTRRLTKFLNKRILQITAINISLKNIYTVFKELAKDLFDEFIAIGQELSKDLSTIFNKISNNREPLYQGC